MKIKLILFTFIITCLLGCSKNKDTELPNNDKKHYNISLSVSGFTQSQSQFDKIASTSHSSSKPLADKLLYVILNKDYQPIDTLMRDIDINKSSQNISFKLLEGDYHLRIVGLNVSEKTNIYFTMNKSVSIDFEQEYLNSEYALKMPEVFISHLNFSVYKDKDLDPVTLQRLNGRIDLIIQDEIPKEAKYINFHTNSPSSLRVSDENTFYSQLITGSVEKKGNYKDIGEISGLLNQTVSINILPQNQRYTELSEQEVHLNLFIYDKNFELIATKDISNVKIAPNTITKLSGNLFDKNKTTQQGLSVVIDTDYSNEIISQSF